jgi:hypothetical protein
MDVCVSKYTSDVHFSCICLTAITSRIPEVRRNKSLQAIHLLAAEGGGMFQNTRREGCSLGRDKVLIKGSPAELIQTKFG